MDTQEDSAIRSEGAELWVQGHLRLEYGLLTAKASRNMPGYDILAFSPDGKKTARIQVKYRKAINSDGMRVHRETFDFVVYVAGRKGFVGQAPDRVETFKRTQFYVLPAKVVQQGLQARDLYPSPTRGSHKQYLNAWHLILEYLGVPEPRYSEDGEEATS